LIASLFSLTASLIASLIRYSWRSLIASAKPGDEWPGERIEALCGRSELFPLHPDHSLSSIVVSGHHGVSFSSQNHHRIILDRSGGKGKLPLEAIVLPQKRVIAHDGSVRGLTDEPIGANEKRVRKEMEYSYPVLPRRANTT
jgi:hypothetical protein